MSMFINFDDIELAAQEDKANFKDVLSLKTRAELEEKCWQYYHHNYINLKKDFNRCVEKMQKEADVYRPMIIAWEMKYNRLKKEKELSDKKVDLFEKLTIALNIQLAKEK